jgi:hypothetical protein
MKILKALLVVIVILIVVIAVLVSSTRREGEKMYAKYAALSTEMIGKNYAVQPFPVKAEYRHIVYPQGLGLFDFSVTSQQADRLARINSIDATMFKFMKMYTLMIRPDYGYNLPVLSVDFIFMPFGKRVFVIEIIDPARIADDNKKTGYDKMKAAAAQTAGFEQTGVRDWYKDFIDDCSIHIKADRTNDDMLFDIYRTFLSAYLDMAKNAQPLTPESSAQVKAGFEKYVDTLLSKGGPAVDVFKKILGPEGQQEYVRTVMFGLEK